eukprot:m.71467 g.71467  ORF g.71467 m.71467 type:complete len:456 (-) comp7635_c0_seq1:636-2003(-)
MADVIGRHLMIAKGYRRSITMASRTDPCGRVPEPAGTISSALAPAMLSRRLLHCTPVLKAMGCAEPSQRRMARWYSGREWSGDTSLASATLTIGKPGLRPIILRRDGATKRWNVTMHDTGFPGSAKTAMSRSCAGSVAYVVGLPGFMLTRAKWIVAPSSASSGLSRSFSPMLTPPDVMTASTPPPSRSFSNAARSVSIVSDTMPRSVTSTPKSCRTAISMNRLLSRIEPLGTSAAPGSTSSSPVDMTATRGRRSTGTVRMPADSSTPSSLGPSTLPAASRRWPLLISDPTARMSQPGLTVLSTRICFSSPSGDASTNSVSSTWTTASAPSGTGAPVVIRATVPGSTRNEAIPPAVTGPSTRNTPGPSAATTAYPSLMEAGNGGWSSGASTSAARIMPRAWRTSMSMAGSAAVRLVMAPMASGTATIGYGDWRIRSATRPRACAWMSLWLALWLQW